MSPSTFQMQSQYYRPNPLTVDTNAQKYFEEEDSGILDESILDHSAVDSGLEMSPPMAGSRRDSFAVSSSLFSPKTEDWQSVDMQSVPSNNPFLEPQHHSNNPFTRGDQSHTSYPQGQQWSMGTGSGACTPFQYDGLDGGYDGGASSLFQRPMPVQTPFSNPGGQIPLFSTVGGPGSQSIPTSPQKDWMSADFKAQSMAKRMRPGSPSIRSHNDLRRGDGIRKKNARFDIPAERNLSNIDHLIAQSTDEQEIKELKQQKRLLRNRQAALDSRQRKKLHTERLEDEKKAYQTHLAGLEDELNEMTLKMEQLCQERDYYQQEARNLRLEKETMIEKHTREGHDLRKQLRYLENTVQSMPSQAGFPNGFNEMDSMAMDTPWDNMGLMGEFAQAPAEAEVKQELQVVPTKKTQVTLPGDMDKPANQGGLLFMLFLVGAFVLSNRSTPNIPRVSEDVREASATLLNNIFKDAGVANAPEASMVAPSAPQASGVNWESTAAMAMGGDHAMGDVAPSMLGELADSLTQPTQEQTGEQLFGMSAAQYNGVQEPEFLMNPSARPPPQNRRNLAEALANMGGDKKQSAADVYTRSLLWEQIPADVVRNFARFVADSNNANEGQQQQQTPQQQQHATEAAA